MAVDPVDAGIDRMLAVDREITAFRRSDRPDWRTYEILKAELIRSFPSCTPEQYDRAIKAIAKMCGV